MKTSKTDKSSTTGKRRRIHAAAWASIRDDRHQLTREKLLVLVECLIDLDALVTRLSPEQGLAVLLLAEGALSALATMTATLKAIIPASDATSDHPDQPMPRPTLQETVVPATEAGNDHAK